MGGLKSEIKQLACRLATRCDRRANHLFDTLTIAVTTYEERYEKWFQPLLHALIRDTREADIVVAVNGQPNRARQTRYLENIRADWGDHERLKFLEHEQPVGVAKLWNEIVLAAKTSHVLILNDDIEVLSCFWRQFAREFDKNAQVTKINGIWSHFIVNKSIFDAIGYFDETFTGIGFEDFDYEGRMWLNDIEPQVMHTPYIYHEWDMPEETSFEEDSKVWGKYSAANEQRFLEKWNVIEPGSGEGLYLPQIEKCITPGTTSLGFWPERWTGS